VGSSILACATSCGRESFPLIDEGFNAASPIAKRTVTHPNDREQGLLSGGVVPYPVLAHIEPPSDVLYSEQRFAQKRRTRADSLRGLRLNGSGSLKAVGFAEAYSEKRWSLAVWVEGMSVSEWVCSR
jgi:hypothetical protein